MRKFYLVFCFALLSGFSVFAQPIINIPDPIFKGYLVSDNTINLNADSDIDSAEAASYTGAISIVEIGVTDLTGIEAFTSATGLYASDNFITTADLSSNVAFTDVHIQNNLLTSIHFGTLPLVSYVDLSHNALTTINTSGLFALATFECSYNQLTSLDISSNPWLGELYCDSNLLTNLQLYGNPNLYILHCRENFLNSLDVQYNFNLSTLYCGENPFTCIDISHNYSLDYFESSNCPNLAKLNLKNGNNGFMTPLVSNCPNLGCVQVDDSLFSVTYWSGFPATSYFSNDCGQPTVTFTHNAPVCNGTPVQFDQTSTNIDWFKWDFGDGDTSTVIVDPAHLYATGGSYFATLTAGNCYGTLQPFASFDLGAPIGGYIDYSGGAFGDGKAILLEYEPIYHTFDTIAIFWGFEVAGYYSFGNVYDGTYIIKVHPDTTVLPDVIPTYSGNQANWETATIINHSCFAADTMDITMLEVTSGIPGSGALSGEVIEGPGFGRAQGDPIHGVDVKLGVSANNIIAATTTDSLGQYTFVGVPDGTYTIYVDIPGLFKDSTYTLTIAPGSYVWTYLDYQVDSNSIDIIGNIGIQELEPNNPNTFMVYPNPVKSNAMIRYTLAENAEVKFDLYNMYGVNVATLLTANESIGEYYLPFNTDALGLKSGIYFITCTTNGKSRTQRIVVLEK